MPARMHERTEAAQPATTMVCPECGHDRFRDGARVDTIVGPLRIVLLLAAPVVMLSVPSPWSWLPLAVVALSIVLRAVGGIYYWGGWKCRGCGYTEMGR